MLRSISLLFSVLISFFGITHAQELTPEFKNLLSQQLEKSGLNDSLLSKPFLVVGLRENYKASDALDTLGCTDFPIYVPTEGTRFDEIELTQFLSSKNSLEDYVNFLRDHDAESALYRAFSTKDGNIVKIQRLSLEFSEEFGSVQSTMFYKNNRLKLICNDYCASVMKILILRELEWSEDQKELEQVKTYIFR